MHPLHAEVIAGAGALWVNSVMGDGYELDEVWVLEHQAGSQ
ncbi:MAG: hypothetical protein AB1894_09810 [Chloroflexota bacterium]